MADGKKRPAPKAAAGKKAAKKAKKSVGGDMDAEDVVEDFTFSSDEQ